MKTLSVFSGGLDSMLASQIIRAQGIEVLALFFETPFFSSQRAKESARAMNLTLKVVDITDRHLKVVKNPLHGYGGNMNPCIDCHALMFRMAGELLEKEGASFIITGEVLGQRPMSQNKRALSIIETESGNKGLILRPLSAKLLSKTIPEEKGWIKRDQLMSFSGRSRKPQMALAERFGIKDYPSPGGGCLLTDKVFSRRLKDLFFRGPNNEIREIELLKTGRHLRIGPSTKLVVGRNKRENHAIRSLSKDTDYIMTTISVPGPTVLAIGDISPEHEELAAAITVSYSDADDDEPAQVMVTRGEAEKIILSKGFDKNILQKYMI